MDPNETLKELLKMCEDGVKDDLDGHYDRMSELVLALDGWLSKGGFLPLRWQRPVDAVDPGTRAEGYEVFRP